MCEKDPLILSYGDSLLRQSDLDLLHGPHWLNDHVISFYFEYLQNLYQESSKLLFVGPEVTQCIKMVAANQLDSFLDPLEARSKDFIFFALNDNQSPDSVGGTHWSLLVYSRADGIVSHFDPSMGINRNQAESFSKKLIRFFNGKSIFHEKKSPQQNNGYDCGVYVIYYAETLAEYLSKHNSMGEQLFENQCPVSSESMRQNIITTIQTLRPNSI